MQDGPLVVGDDKFIERLSGAGKPEVEPEGIAQISVTVDPQGNLIGDTSHLDPHILDQLQTPEAKAMMRSQYRGARYEDEPKRAPKYVNEGTRRDFTKLRPAGMDRATHRKLKRKVFKDLNKQALRMKKGT